MICQTRKGWVDGNTHVGCVQSAVLVRETLIELDLIRQEKRLCSLL
jgi:hypothetical protein